MDYMGQFMDTTQGYPVVKKRIAAECKCHYCGNTWLKFLEKQPESLPIVKCPMCSKRVYAQRIIN